MAAAPQCMENTGRNALFKSFFCSLVFLVLHWDSELPEPDIPLHSVIREFKEALREALQGQRR